ncbi:hypothetical protein D3C75_1214430 [compost metagenome]
MPAILPTKAISMYCITIDNIICLLVYPIALKDPILLISSSMLFPILNRTTIRHTIAIIKAKAIAITDTILDIKVRDVLNSSISELDNVLVSSTIARVAF